MCTKSFSDRLRLHFQLFSTPFFRASPPPTLLDFHACFSYIFLLLRRCLHKCLHINAQTALFCTYFDKFRRPSKENTPNGRPSPVELFVASSRRNVQFQSSFRTFVRPGSASWRYFRIVRAQFSKQFSCLSAFEMPSSGEVVTNGVCRCAEGCVGYKGE